MPTVQPVPAAAKLIEDARNGTLVLNPNGMFTYDPNEGFSGVDRFTYKLSELETADSRYATVTITVTP